MLILYLNFKWNKSSHSREFQREASSGLRDTVWESEWIGSVSAHIHEVSLLLREKVRLISSGIQFSSLRETFQLFESLKMSVDKIYGNSEAINAARSSAHCQLVLDNEKSISFSAITLIWMNSIKTYSRCSYLYLGGVIMINKIQNNEPSF